jgi:aspartyl protease family protein
VFDRFILLALTPITLAGGALGWTSFDLSRPDAQSRADAVVMTAGTVSAVTQPRQDGRSSGTTLLRSGDGLFYAMVELNGQPVRLMIDTGATKSVLSLADARRIGDVRLSDRSVGTMRTLGGNRRYRSADVGTVAIGSQTVDDVKFAVVSSDAPVSLIGQDVLRKLGPITLDGERMILP